jgi:uncharacterized membrane protein
MIVFMSCYLPERGERFKIGAWERELSRLNTVTNHRAYRLSSIDMLRGLVIVIMAIDHTRDFFHAGAAIDPMGDANVSLPLALTRWITHFCAPVFVLLSGTSAGLMLARKSPQDLCKFLLTRGAWLILVEIFVISTAITLSPGGLAEFGGRTLAFMQVIWVIGASMVLLAFAQFLGRKTCLVVGALIVLGHNSLDPIWPTPSLVEAGPPVWVALHASMSAIAGPFQFMILYPLLPWFGVMLLGFGVSTLFELEPAARDRALLRWGTAITGAFLLLRFVDVYGEPNHWQAHALGAATLIDFLNTTKYPPSLQFLTMTLGPAAIFCAYASRMRGFLQEMFVMFGRVPFAFYVAHFYLLHALSVLLGVMQGFSVQQMMTFPLFYPKGYGVSLPVVYIVWASVIAALYPFCRWMAGVKSRSRAPWLSYV